MSRLSVLLNLCFILVGLTQAWARRCWQLAGWLLRSQWWLVFSGCRVSVAARESSARTKNGKERKNGHKRQQKYRPLQTGLPLYTLIE
jgi:hypothetical protein